jgi:hypothetical protein
MTGPGDWPGDDAAAEVMTLLPAERQVLAALAAVGHASLSADELAELIEVEDVAPLVADLERRGLVKTDEKKRYSALGRVGEEIRHTDAALATGDRVLKYMTTLARGGQLTPERLVENAEAILGLSEWAAETEQWAALLELVKTLQSCFAIAHRVQEWLALLERGRNAAQALGDHQSEVWLLQQLARASASAGDTASAQSYLREADELQRGRKPGARRVAKTDEAASSGGRAAAVGGGIPRLAFWIIGLIAAAGAGVGTGLAIGNDNGNAGVTTTPVSITVTVGGQTLTTHETLTLPATTVLSTTTILTTTTETTTTTVTTGPG